MQKIKELVPPELASEGTSDGLHSGTRGPLGAVFGVKPAGFWSIGCALRPGEPRTTWAIKSIGGYGSDLSPKLRTDGDTCGEAPWGLPFRSTVRTGVSCGL